MSQEDTPNNDRPDVVPSDEWDYNYEEGLKYIEVPSEFLEPEPDVNNHWWNEGDRIRRAIALQTDAMVRTTVKSHGDDDNPSNFFYNEGDEIFQFLSRTSPYFTQQLGFVINTCVTLRLSNDQIAPIAYLAGQESHRFDMSPDELNVVIKKTFALLVSAAMGSSPPKFHKLIVNQITGIQNVWTRYAFQGQRNPSDGSPKPGKEEDGDMGM